MNFGKSSLWLGAALVLAISAGVAVFSLSDTPERETKEPIKIAVQLPWLHTSAFAGYYAADRNGDYAKEGLAVNFLEGSGKVDPVARVVAGQAQFGLASANHLLEARAKGLPVRVVAVMHQINPVLFTTLEGSGITHPRQFAGRVINASATNLPVLRALMQRFRIEPTQYTVVHENPTKIDLYYNGDIDVWTGFHFSTKRRLENDGRKAHFMYPDDYGVHFCRDCIFTTDEVIEKHPELVTAFLRATLIAGWGHAVRHPESAGTLTARYNPGADPKYQVEFLSAMIPLINNGEVPVGWMKPEIWARMADTLYTIGALAAPMDPERLYTMRFLKDIYGKPE